MPSSSSNRLKATSRRRKDAYFRLLPHQLEMGDPPLDPDEVERPVADDLVSDVEVAAPQYWIASGMRPAPLNDPVA